MPTEVEKLHKRLLEMGTIGFGVSGGSEIHTAERIAEEVNKALNCMEKDYEEIKSSCTIKAHYGRIKDWVRTPCGSGLGYYIQGKFLDHPEIAGLYGHTSYVVKFDRFDDKTGPTCVYEIETRNSRYSLIGEELK